MYKLNSKYIILILISIIYYLYNSKEKDCPFIIYLFIDSNLEQKKSIEWNKVEEYLKNNKIKHKKIDLNNPIYTEWKKNFNIKILPSIIKVRNDGFRIIYNGKYEYKNIIAWVFENK